MVACVAFVVDEVFFVEIGAAKYVFQDYKG